MSSHLLQLEVGVARVRVISFLLELDGGGRALEVEAGADLLGGVLHGVLHLHHVGLAHGIE
jgi:hypothetical protein